MWLSDPVYQTPLGNQLGRYDSTWLQGSKVTIGLNMTKCAVIIIK